MTDPFGVWWNDDAGISRIRNGSENQRSSTGGGGASFGIVRARCV